MSPERSALRLPPVPLRARQLWGAPGLSVPARARLPRCLPRPKPVRTARGRGEREGPGQQQRVRARLAGKPVPWVARREARGHSLRAVQKGWAEDRRTPDDSPCLACSSPLLRAPLPRHWMERLAGVKRVSPSPSSREESRCDRRSNSCRMSLPSARGPSG